MAPSFFFERCKEAWLLGMDHAHPCHGTTNLVGGSIVLGVVLSINSIPDAPEDLGDQGQRVQCCSCSPSTQKMLVVMGASAPLRQPRDHLI